jgi:beta-lactamase class A
MSFYARFSSLGQPLFFLFLGALLMAALIRLPERQCEAQYAYINAREVCGPRDAISKAAYGKTQGEIESYIERERAAGRILGASVYFRDLENGPVFGVNENDDFAPASLLKLPLALVYLTQAERDPSLLSEQLSVSEPQWDFVVNFPSSQPEIDPQEPHTVDELLMHMLKHSDNNAYGVLQTHLYEIGQKDLITKTFLELGFLSPADISDEVLSVRRYGAIFRALYNVSYLNAELSEKMLSLLSDTEFKIGLDDGVPDSIHIAHKFGERTLESGERQLHDCGIIYYPKNPYLLCVMTRGNEFKMLDTVITEISRVVYEEVNSRRL